RTRILAGIAAPGIEIAVNDQGVALNLDRNAVDRRRRAAGAGERRDAGLQANVERSFDANSLKARDAEIAAGPGRGRGEQASSGRCNEEGAHSPTFLQHG